jgi:hypothetical protein
MKLNVQVLQNQFGSTSGVLLNGRAVVDGCIEISDAELNAAMESLVSNPPEAGGSPSANIQSQNSPGNAASPHAIVERRSICSVCDQNSEGTCLQSNQSCKSCSDIEIKTKWATASCPIKKWGPETL